MDVMPMRERRAMKQDRQYLRDIVVSSCIKTGIIIFCGLWNGKITMSCGVFGGVAGVSPAVGVGAYGGGGA